MENLDLSYFFKTKLQAGDFSTRLATISQQIYETHFSLETALVDAFGMQKKDKFIVLLRDNAVNTDSPTALKEFLDKLQEKIAALPVLSLTIAFEPKEQTLITISEWFLLHMKRQVLFETITDPQLIAGAAITFNGKFLDFSVKSKFEGILNSIVKPIDKMENDQTISTPSAKDQSADNITDRK